MLDRLNGPVDGRPQGRHGVRPLQVAALLLLFASTAFGQRNLTKIPPPDPEIERKSFRVADGFEVTLFAADPAIAKPIQMNFDAAGRLWIASSEVYPHIKPGQKATDKILVLEDADGDGVSDKTTVFADGLLIPTGVLPSDGGAYVANSTELLHLRDTNGDGKADRERVVLSGFGTEDTHHILHTFRRSPEGYLTFNQSIYIHSHIETPYGVRRLNGGGIWWFRPETMRLEVHARGLINPWGNAWTEHGQLFATDGAGGEGVNDVVRGAYYRTAVGAKRLLRGLNPGSPKYCGLEMVDGRHLPDDWQGDLITNDFRGNRICRFKVTESGSGFVSRQQADVITSNHVAFRPIDIKLGPDGAIYVADWYNPIIQHGEVDFRDPRRDHVHGRIWRITAKNRDTLPRPNLVEATVPELLEHLKSPESWTRKFARGRLRETGREAVAEQLAAWIRRLDDATETDAHTERHRLNGLWVQNALRIRDVDVLKRCLSSETASVRAAACRMIGYWIVEAPEALPSPVSVLSPLVGDVNGRVRLEAVRALAVVGTAEAVEVAMRALEFEVDATLEYALWLTAWELRGTWVPELQAGRLHFGGNADQLLFALRAADSPAVVPALTALLDRSETRDGRSYAIARAIALLGGPAELTRVLKLAADEKTPVGERRALLDSLVESAGRRRRPPTDIEPLAGLLADGDGVVQSRAIELAGLWRAQAVRGELLKAARDEEGTIAVRSAAITAYSRIPGSDRNAAVEAVALDAAFPGPLRIAAVSSLVDLAPKRAATVAVAVFGRVKTSDPTPVFEAFLRRKGGPAPLVTALAEASLPPDVAKQALRVVSAAGRPYPELTAALEKAGDVTTGPRKLSAAEMASFVEAVAATGDPARGEAVFRRGDLACLKCHSIGGAGGRVGPDLVSIGASAPVDYLVQSLFDPNAKVKENYHTIVAVTDEGKVFAGIPVRQSKEELVLRDAEGREITLGANEIEERVDGASLMPTGLVERLPRAEVVDLVRFLSELGKEGPYRVRPGPVVRSWEVMRATPDAAFRLRRTSYDTATGDDVAYTWAPRYSTVAGSLPMADLPEIRVRNRVADGTKGVAFARTTFEVDSPAATRIVIPSTEGIRAWVDAEPIEPGETTVNLARGSHRLTLAVDLAQRRKADLRVSIETDAGG